MGGRAAAVDAIRLVVPSHIAIVEDAAHALAAAYADGRPMGSSQNLTCFSFYANKNVSTGEGGAIALQSETLARRLESLRQHGLPQDAWKRYMHAQHFDVPRVTSLGYKMNYTDLQAAVGRVQLRRLPVLQQRRLEIARVYAESLARLPCPIRLQAGVTETGHARHLFVIQLPVEELRSTRDEILQELRRRNIGASLHYQPVHTLDLYADGRSAPLPATDWVAPRILTLPMSASMTVDDARDVVAALDDVLQMGKRVRVAVGGR
jgi:perosamine synthetase